MKSTLTTGLAVLMLLLAVSCKKENIAQSPAITNESSTQEDITNSDGTGIPQVKIGTQIWMTKNLNVRTYRNGVPIPRVDGPAQWTGLTTGAFCWYNKDTAIGHTYGRLYNWYAVNDPRGLAPKGWHIPSQEEWLTLINYLGGYQVAGGKVKEAGTAHWLSPNTGATNSTGFTALPGGFRVQHAVYGFIGAQSEWWTATDYNDHAYIAEIYYNSAQLTFSNNYKYAGLSVRCIKD